MKKNRHLISIVLIGSLGSTQAVEYIYPVTYTKQQENSLILLLCQKKGRIELLSWNLATKEVGKLLSSRFMPTSIQLLPDQSGFSFIDQGVIWVKSFSKRSPRALDLPAPLCDIDLIFWKDEKSCYFSARQDDRYALFELDVESNLDCLVSVEHADCIYPQKVEKTLFFLLKDSVNDIYHLFKTDYPIIYHESLTFNSRLNFDKRVDKLFCAFQRPYKSIVSLQDCCSLYTFETHVAFLKMISDVEGFVIGYPRTISEDVILCCYYHLVQRRGCWDCSLLFSFSLPLYLVKSLRRKNYRQELLHESILPLLPLYVSRTREFYYTHFEEGLLNAYSYSLENGQSKKVVVAPPGYLYFSPLCIDNRLIYGGVIDTGVNRSYYIDDVPFMWLDDRGQVCLNLFQMALDGN